MDAIGLRRSVRRPGRLDRHFASVPSCSCSLLNSDPRIDARIDIRAAYCT